MHPVGLATSSSSSPVVNSPSSGGISGKILELLEKIKNAFKRAGEYLRDAYNTTFNYAPTFGTRSIESHNEGISLWDRIKSLFPSSDTSNPSTMNRNVRNFENGNNVPVYGGY